MKFCLNPDSDVVKKLVHTDNFAISLITHLANKYFENGDFTYEEFINHKKIREQLGIISKAEVKRAIGFTIPKEMSYEQITHLWHKIGVVNDKNVQNGVKKLYRTVNLHGVSGTSWMIDVVEKDDNIDVDAKLKRREDDALVTNDKSKLSKFKREMGAFLTPTEPTLDFPEEVSKPKMMTIQEYDAIAQPEIMTAAEFEKYRIDNELPFEDEIFDQKANSELGGEFNKALAQKIQDKLEKLYPEIKLNITNNPVWEQGGNVFNQQEFNNQVNYRLKATEILLSDRAKQIFDKGSKNGWDLNKILTELAIPKEQKALLLDLGIIDREQLALELASKYSFAVEINTAKEKKPVGADGEYFNEEGRQISKYEFDILNKDRNTYYYSNLTVPGGTNYTENRIITPQIVPSIKGHAQFAEKEDIGWFRSDDKTIEGTFSKETKLDDINIEDIPNEFQLGETRFYLQNNEWYMQNEDSTTRMREVGLGEPEVLIAYKSMLLGLTEIDNNLTGENYRVQNSTFGTPTKIRRILEVQSDLLQKGRDKHLLVNYTNDLGQNEFLQLLNKDNNWVKFFISTIIQDSAKKGYEKVLFPKGETAAKIEGHETIADEINRINNQLKNINDNINLLDNEKSIWNIIQNANSFELRYEDRFSTSFFKENGKWFKIIPHEPEFYGDESYILQEKTEDEIKKIVENYREYANAIAVKNVIITTDINNSVSELQTEKQRLENERDNLKSQGIEKLAPIEAFYEIRVGNILEKQFGKDNVKTITDEYGNQWREITINQARDLEDILLQKNEADKIIGQANIKAGTVLIDAINQKQDTLPHEFAHHYIAWFRDTPIVQEAIKKWGSEEALVQSIGEQVVKQKGEAYNWWNKFVKWVLKLFNSLSKLQKEELTLILTDAFLTRQDLNTIVPIKPGVPELFESNTELANAVYMALGFTGNISDEQKQQAQQLYSQYLSTIFPNSKVKDIVYHFGVKSLSEFNKPNRGKGIYFTTDKDGKYVFYPNIIGIKTKESRTNVLVNIKTIQYGKKNILFKTLNDKENYYYNENKLLELQNNIIQLRLNKASKEQINEAIKIMNNFEPKKVEFQTINIENNLKDDNINVDGLLIESPLSGVNTNDNFIVVFEPEQIHILGSKQDTQMFAEFVRNKSISPQEFSIESNLKDLDFNEETLKYLYERSSKSKDFSTFAKDVLSYVALTRSSFSAEEIIEKLNCL